MTYDAQLSFFKNTLERIRIPSVLTEKGNVPTNIDMGLRNILGMSEDYQVFFDRDIMPDVGNIILKITDPFLCNYIFIPLPRENGTNHLIVGPYTCVLINRKDISKGAAPYRLPQGFVKDVEKCFSVIPYIADDQMILSLVNSLGEVIFGGIDKFTLENMNVEQFSRHIAVKNPEQKEKSESGDGRAQIIEKVYAAENKLMENVSKGLLNNVQLMYSNIKPSNILENRIVDQLRNIKNYLIILNTLLRKAAENGGVHPLHIDEVSSDFALRIEAAKNPEECDELFSRMIQKYCRLVNKYSQTNYSLLIQKAVTHIDSDLQGDLTLHSISSLLKVNPSYLSTLFKKETGHTLTEFVNKRRIDRAKQLLTSGNAQIQIISQNCGIVDVNYFTKLFKKHTGFTPKAYRENYKDCF